MAFAATAPVWRVANSWVVREYAVQVFETSEGEVEERRGG